MRTASIVSVAGSFVFLVGAWIAMPCVSGDTPFVMDGSNALLTCLHRKLNHWGLMTPVGDWPLLQHVPDLISIGWARTGIPRANESSNCSA